MNPGRRINRPQRGSRARLAAAAFAAALLASLAQPRPALAQASDYDDGGTTVVGSASGGVTVDLSVLNDLGAPDRGRDLRFPGSQVGPDQSVRLHPPEIQLHPPRKKARRVRRPPASVRPKPKPTPPPESATAEAPAVPAAPPPPPKVASAPPEPMSPAPAPMPAMPEASAPAQAPEMSRSAVAPPAVPEPPPATSSASPLPPDLPPITPAPRETVDSNKLTVPPPPPAPEASKSETQTASLPPATSGSTGGFAPGVTRAIAFGGGEATLGKAGEATLKDAAQALTKDAALRVELKAYATGDKDNESRARRLSLSRALAVRSFLIKQGVQATRIDVRALGSQVPSGPADRVDVTLISR